jgi:hypothetical protein
MQDLRNYEDHIEDRSARGSLSNLFGPIENLRIRNGGRAKSALLEELALGSARELICFQLLRFDDLDPIWFRTRGYNPNCTSHMKCSYFHL